MAPIRALLDIPGARSMVALIPMREQAVDSWWNAAKCLYGLKDENRFALQTALLRAVAPDRLVDLTPDLLAAQDRPTYLRLDGHAVAAGAVARHLRALALLP